MLVTCAGILVVDLIATNLPKVSDPGELTYAPRGIEIHSGGHAGNVSIDLRKLGVTKGEISSISSVGKDIFGEFQEKLLKRHGIITHLQKIANVGSSKNLVLVVANEDRRFHVDVGANMYLNPEFVKSILKQEKPSIFYAGGVGFTGKFDDELDKVLKDAKDLGCITFIDPVTPFNRKWDFIIKSLKSTDIFHCNHDEALDITRKENSIEAAKFMLKKGANLVVISLGSEGLIAVTKKTYFRFSAFKVPFVDPTGAGDALCAGIIRGLLKIMNGKKYNFEMYNDEDLTDIFLEGMAAGASCVTKAGTTTAVTEKNVNRLLRDQRPKIFERRSLTL